MEFTKLLKYGSAILFLAIVGHSFLTGLNGATLLLSLGLLLFLFKMEQSLVLSERAEFNTKIQEILTSHSDEMYHLKKDHGELIKNISDKHEFEQKEIQKKLDAINSQMNMVKTAQGLTKRF